MEPFLRVEGLTKVYSSGSESLEVLKGLDVALEAGSSVVITGESGSGKTTLLHLVAAMDVPTGGRIMVGGLDLGRAGEAELSHYRNRTIGLVFQFHYLLKEFTALENVTVPARMAGMGAGPARARALDLLDQVGLAPRAKHYPSQLSGGERQRVALARALMNDPALILADEPTGNLDEKNGAMVEKLLFSLARQHRKTLLLVTHNRAISKDGDQHWHLRGGTLDPQDPA